MLRKSQFKQLTFRKYANFNVLGALFWVQKESFTVIRFNRTYKILPSKGSIERARWDSSHRVWLFNPLPPQHNTHISGNSGSCSGSLLIICLKAPFPSLKRHTFLIGKHPSVEQIRSMTIPKESCFHFPKLLGIFKPACEIPWTPGSG